jgi:hypothetical protein
MTSFDILAIILPPAPSKLITKLPPAALQVKGFILDPIPAFRKTLIKPFDLLEHDYTQREVADHLGIDFTSVSRIMREKDKMLTK